MNKLKIAFFYPKFFPVTGGSSVHGYYLAKELCEMGHQIFIFNGQSDDFTISYKRSIAGFVRGILDSDIVYVRFGLFSAINFVPILARLLGKKVVVELNSPSDELLLYSSNKNKSINLKKYDFLLKICLKFANQIIMVSQNGTKYCTDILKLNNVTAIENGGEKFEAANLNVSNETKAFIKKIKISFKKIVLWSGTNEEWQGFDLVKKVISKTRKDIAFLIITKDESIREIFTDINNIFIVTKMERDDLKYITINSDFGFASRGSFDWCRVGYYGSSTKYYEYLINGLQTISQPYGAAIRDNFSNLYLSENPSDISSFIENNIKFEIDTSGYRSWKHVAQETETEIMKVLQSEGKFGN